jgi:hypothetical protein
VRHFRVIVYRVKTNRIKTSNQEKMLAELLAQNPKHKTKVEFLKVDWRMKILKAGILHGPLLIDMAMPEEANSLVLNGLPHENELKKCKSYYSECNITQLWLRLQE